MCVHLHFVPVYVFVAPCFSSSSLFEPRETAPRERNEGNSEWGCCCASASSFVLLCLLFLLGSGYHSYFLRLLLKVIYVFPFSFSCLILAYFRYINMPSGRVPGGAYTAKYYYYIQPSRMYCPCVNYLMKHMLQKHMMDDVRTRCLYLYNI